MIVKLFSNITSLGGRRGFEKSKGKADFCILKASQMPPFGITELFFLKKFSY